MTAWRADGTAGAWAAIAEIAAAHATMLRDAGLIDGDALAVLLEAIDSARRGPEPDAAGLLALAAAFDERADELAPAEYATVAQVGRNLVEVGATAARMLMRERLLAVAGALAGCRSALLDLAERHPVTLLPAYVDRAAAQPTTVAHFLGGVVGPLGRAAEHVQLAYRHTNRSPMGAGLLASSGLPIDRERVAALLGFEGLVENTFDAVAAADHFVAAADAAATIVAPLGRFLGGLLLLVRSEPGSLRFPDAWVRTFPDQPHLAMLGAIEGLSGTVERLVADAGAVRSLAGAAPFAPLAGALDPIVDATLDHLGGCAAAVDAVRELVAGMEVNRALLANRANRGLITSGDLVDFLMAEEQLDPASARGIAALTVARARDQGIEAAGITPELIDGAALLVIGRELKVEFEAISRYLAPRRFIERRTATGAPSPAATRAYLEGERERLAADARWRQEAEQAVTAATGLLAKALHITPEGSA